MIAIAVDDEVLMLGALGAAIEASPDITAVERFSDCEAALDFVKDHHADIAFFSVASITRDGKLYDIFEEENPPRIAMLKNATRKVFLSDSTKFGKISPYFTCTTRDIDYIVTDKEITQMFDDIHLPEIVY